MAWKTKYEVIQHNNIDTFNMMLQAKTKEGYIPYSSISVNILTQIVAKTPDLDKVICSYALLLGLTYEE